MIMPTKTEIRDLITKRRRQILIHSIIYYTMDDNLISDHTWAEWAKELCELQEQFPEIADECVYAEPFSEFDPSTGYNLPLNDQWANRKARQLLATRDRMRKEDIYEQMY